MKDYIQYLPYVLDAVPFLLIIGFAVYGRSRGLLYSLLSVVIIFASLFAVKMYTPVVAEKIAGDSSLFIMKPVYTAAASVAVYAVAKIVLRIVAKAVNLVTKLPVIKPVNNILGCFLGIIQGVLLLTVLIAVVIAVEYRMPESQAVQIINQSRVISWLSQKFIKLLSGGKIL